MNEELWERLIENIQYDIDHSDCSALYELLSLLPDGALSNYLPENDDLPLNIVWERPYNVPVDTSINDELFQADADIQKTLSKILTDEA